MAWQAIVIARDLMMSARLEGAARAAGYEVTVRGAPGDAPDDAPAIVVVDLDQPGTVDALGAWRERYPSMRIVGFLSHVDAGTRETAEAAGIEVYPRGASARAAGEILRGDQPHPS